MKKVINPCFCKTYRSSGMEVMSRAFAEIEFSNGRLSIHGVIGPMVGGNCLGGAGQCVEEMREGTPNDGWTREMLDKFCNIWDRWHLNDMNPCCEHQRSLGWLEQAKETMTMYHYRLTAEARAKKNAAEQEALRHLAAGETFVPTPEQVLFAGLPTWRETYSELGEGLALYYEPNANSIHGATETKARGWVRFDEDPHGILCKPCPVCGYKYGTSWKTEEVPQDVIDWLFALPDTTKRPAWV